MIILTFEMKAMQYFMTSFIDFSIHFSQRNLDRHIAVVHEQVRPFECGICGMTFSRKEKLHQHTDRFHQDELGEPISDIIVETQTNLQTIQVQTIQTVELHTNPPKIENS